MKRFSFFLASGLILALITLSSTRITVAQPPSPPDLTGSWKYSLFGVVTNWWGESELEIESGTFSIRENIPNDPNIDPNLLIDLPDTDDDFIGFAHDGVFAFYKENLDNCGGPSVNFGREMIIGAVNESGTKLRGKGMGFDSNLDCGGPWFYFFRATKTSKMY